MKRYISLLLALILTTFSFSANSETVVIKENFSIRSGITFQMSALNVDKHEKANGSKTNDWISDYLVAPSRYCYKTTLAGEEVGIAYWFDKNNCLNELQYVLYTQNHYSDVKASLVNKYGNAHFINSPPIIETNRFFFYENFKSLNPVIKDYVGWLVQYNDCYVLIEANQIYLRSLGTLGYITYHPLSYEDMSNYQIIQNTLDETKQQSIKDDL